MARKRKGGQRLIRNNNLRSSKQNHKRSTIFQSFRFMRDNVSVGSGSLNNSVHGLSLSTGSRNSGENVSKSKISNFEEGADEESPKDLEITSQSSEIDLPTDEHEHKDEDKDPYILKTLKPIRSRIFSTRFLRGLSTATNLDVDHHEDDYKESEQRTRYRIRANRKVKHDDRFLSKVRHFFGCWDSTRLDAFTYDNMIGYHDNSSCSKSASFFCCCHNFSRNYALISYLSWSFRTSFTMLFLSMSVVFFCLIICFTFWLMIFGTVYPTCFQPTYNEAGTPFADAYALSWTTFTTVGYGHVYPSRGIDEPHQSMCYWVHILCTLESFVGVIFAGCCGAIIFGKVMRIQSLAPVTFSDPITVRYGTGVRMKRNGNHMQMYNETDDDKIPCPILTFRLANLHSDKAGGEIVDSQINVLAIRNEEVVDLNSLLNMSNNKNEKNAVRRKRASSKKYDPSKNDNEHETENKQIQTNKIKNKKHEEDPGDASRPATLRRYFYNLVVDAPDNPYFKRTWTVSHTLDQDSPLVIPEVQRAIADNDGYWPSYLDDAESVRRSIGFDQIFVSVSGISVVSADSVYAQHLYSHVDMNVGYQFAPVLYRDGVQNIKVDYEILNDVTEQYGGGGETFYDEDFEEGVLRNKYSNQRVVSLPDK